MHNNTPPDQRSKAFAASYALEAARIEFLASSRGRDAAREFARRTFASYRRAVVRRLPPAGEPGFRIRLTASCCFFRRYLGSDRS